MIDHTFSITSFLSPHTTKHTLCSLSREIKQEQHNLSLQSLHWPTITINNKIISYFPCTLSFLSIWSSQCIFVMTRELCNIMTWCGEDSEQGELSPTIGFVLDLFDHNDVIQKICQFLSRLIIGLTMTSGHGHCKRWQIQKIKKKRNQKSAWEKKMLSQIFTCIEKKHHKMWPNTPTYRGPQRARDQGYPLSMVLGEILHHKKHNFLKPIGFLQLFFGRLVQKKGQKNGTFFSPKFH